MSIDLKLNVNQVYKVLEYLKADPKLEDTGNISSLTVCHHGAGRGQSRKLIYYENSKLFVCYTRCPEDHFGITKLVEKALNVSRYKAINTIEKITGVFDDYISNEEGFFDEYDDITNEDMEYITVDTKKEEKCEVTRYNKDLLNSFYPMYHKSFIDDNISVKSMKKFGLLFDIEKYRIIIPHYYHEDDSLIAIRCRNLQADLVEIGLKYTPITMEVSNQKNDKNCKKMVKKSIVSKTSSYVYGLGRVAEAIKTNKIVILFESEKSVMQMDTYFGDRNCSVATMGSFLSPRQVEILIESGAEEVVIAYDKEYEKYGSPEEKMYRKKIRKRLIEKLLPYFKVSVIYDKWGLLDYKDSPSDKGAEVFKKLFSKRFYITG